MVSDLRKVGVTGLCQHSAYLVPGDAFIAYPGGRSDGRDYIGDALARGAEAIVVETAGLTPSQSAMLDALTVPVFKVAHLAQQVPALADAFYGHPSQQMHVIAVTGTNGKTSIAHGLNQMYRTLDVSVAMIGTLGIGTLQHYIDNPLTTPDPVSLQRHLAEMYASGVETVVMEASSGGLDQGRLSATNIRVAIFTNLTQDHLDYHHTLEAYGQAKAKLYQMPSVETVVINLDDPWCVSQLDHIPRDKKVIGYTCQQNTHSRCDSIISAIRDADGYTLHEGKTQAHLAPQLVGDFNISNLLAMIGAMRVDGFALSALAEAASRVSGIPGRLECISTSNEPRVIVDFAHTPDALLKALTTLRPTVRGKLWCVFGCGGDRDMTKRPIMGGIAARYADKVIITSDNPRDESPEHIAEMILEGMPMAPEVILDRKEAIAHAIQSAHVDDTILIAGKGHEKTQVIAGVSIPFSDQAIARQFLDKRSDR